MSLWNCSAELSFVVSQVWYGANPVIVITDPALGRAVNLRNPNRHQAIGPATIMRGKARTFDSEGILLTQE